MIRVGTGIDFHPLVDGRKLILGGVDVPSPKGLSGHSDADVVIHALCDAILGAIGQGDIGEHFPDSDPAFKGISSKAFLYSVAEIMLRQNYYFGNIDITIIANYPKLAPYKEEMRKCLASILDLEVEQINIKATTTNGLAFGGQGPEGVAAFCTILIEKRDER